MRRTRNDQKFSPERYGMVLCPDCTGSGKCFIDSKGDHVCKTCGGFGLIKKQEKAVVLDKRYPTIFQAESVIHK